MARSMNHRPAAVVIAALAFLASVFISISSPAYAACNKSFRVYNDTDTAIEQLYVAPTSASNWEDDVLGDDTIDSGTSKVIDMSADTRDLKLYDVKAVFSNGAVVSGGKIPICRAVQVHIHGDHVSYST